MSEHGSLTARVSPPAEHDAALPALVAAARRNGAESVADRLAELQRWLAADLGGLHQALGRVGPRGESDLAWRAARYLLDQPGKRIRPLCVLLAARLGGRPFDDAVRRTAMAAELVHAATLLHDDVIDQGTERRGAATARVVYGNAASVLGGDHLLVEALRRIDGLGVGITRELINTIGSMVHAEALQLERRRRFNPDRSMYLSIVEGKTAALFEFALVAGGQLGEVGADGLAALAEYGRALGMTFQIVDDLLDLTGDPTETGKNACADLREGKLTWPLIVAGERNPEVALRLRAVAAADGEIDDAAATELVAAIAATGAIEAARDEATRYADNARRALERLPAGPARRALALVIDGALDRRK